MGVMLRRLCSCGHQAVLAAVVSYSAWKPSSTAHVALQAGLLLAETEYVKQVESDIASYKGLLMGLFFMTVRSHL